MDIEGRTTIITGGASGIGEQIARQIVAAGGRVGIVDIRGDQAEAVARSLGDNAFALQCNVADAAAVEAMAEEAWRISGGIDLVFANAGVGRSGQLIDITPEEFDFVAGVNQRGVWAICKAFANRMIAAGRSGHLCITGSEHSLGFQHAGAGVYTGTKHAVLGLADVFRHELPDNIGVSVLCPGLANTHLSTSGDYGDFEPTPPDVLAFTNLVLAEGMDPAIVAKAALDGVARGDFLIVTHASAFAAARTRFNEIEAAFAAQAPMYEGAEQQSVESIMARVMAQSENAT